VLHRGLQKVYGLADVVQVVQVSVRFHKLCNN